MNVARAVFKQRSIKSIIRRMLGMYKSLWKVLIPAFAILIVGAEQPLIFLEGKWYMPYLAGSLAFLALLCGVAGIISLIKNIQDERQKEKKAKEPSVYEERGTREL